MHRLPLFLLSLILGALPVSAQYRTLTPEAGQDGPKRAALVLGNAAYTHATPLQNAVNDAADMASALQAVGFTVVTGTDLSLREMRGALNDFTDAARGAEVALVFFAGHGVEVGGENYLVPVDADIQARADVAYEALAAGRVLARADEAVGDGLAILMLDACRNDPFRAWRSASGGGLSAMNGPSGSVIAYATAPGSVASDNPRGRNGLYTEVLLEELARPGLEFSQLLRRVGGIVADRSGGEQQPWVAASYAGDFYVVPGRDETTAAPPPVGQPALGESDPAGESETVHVTVEEPPQVLNIQEFRQCVTYPERLRRLGIEGRVMVDFVIAKDGSVTAAEIAQSAHEELDAEAVRCVQQLRFRPGRHGGQPVLVQFSVPVNFQLRDPQTQSEGR